MGNITEEKESEMEDIVCDALEKLKWHCPELYYKALYCLHTVAFGEHFDESLAKKAVFKTFTTTLSTEN